MVCSIKGTRLFVDGTKAISGWFTLNSSQGSIAGRTAAPALFRPLATPPGRVPEKKRFTLSIKFD